MNKLIGIVMLLAATAGAQVWTNAPAPVNPPGWTNGAAPPPPWYDAVTYTGAVAGVRSNLQLQVGVVSWAELSPAIRTAISNGSGSSVVSSAFADLTGAVWENASASNAIIARPTGAAVSGYVNSVIASIPDTNVTYTGTSNRFLLVGVDGATGLNTAPQRTDLRSAGYPVLRLYRNTTTSTNGVGTCGQFFFYNSVATGQFAAGFGVQSDWAAHYADRVVSMFQMGGRSLGGDTNWEWFVKISDQTNGSTIRLSIDGRDGKISGNGAGLSNLVESVTRTGGVFMAMSSDGSVQNAWGWDFTGSNGPFVAEAAHVRVGAENDALYKGGEVWIDAGSWGGVSGAFIRLQHDANNANPRIVIYGQIYGDGGGVSNVNADLLGGQAGLYYRSGTNFLASSIVASNKLASGSISSNLLDAPLKTLLGGSGSWVATAGSALNMAGYSISNAATLTVTNSAQVGGVTYNGAGGISNVASIGWTNCSYVYAYSTNAFTVANTSLVSQTFGIESEDRLAEFNPATGIFTPRNAGDYLISYVGLWQALDSAKDYQTRVNIDGTAIIFWWYDGPAVANYMPITFSQPVTLTATSSVSIIHYQNSGGSESVGINNASVRSSSLTIKRMP